MVLTPFITNLIMHTQFFFATFCDIYELSNFKSKLSRLSHICNYSNQPSRQLQDPYLLVSILQYNVFLFHCGWFAQSTVYALNYRMYNIQFHAHILHLNLGFKRFWLLLGSFHSLSPSFFLAPFFYPSLPTGGGSFLVIQRLTERLAGWGTELSDA